MRKVAQFYKTGTADSSKGLLHHVQHWPMSLCHTVLSSGSFTVAGEKDTQAANSTTGYKMKKVKSEL